MIRLLTIDDYDDICRLWKNTPGLGLNGLDDSREGILRFLLRNPASNFVAVEDGRIVGTILSGHDGRRGHIYHACVDTEFRRRRIGTKLVHQVINAMKEENIHKLTLVALKNNDQGNDFWSRSGWMRRDDLNMYALSLENDN